MTGGAPALGRRRLRRFALVALAMAAGAGGMLLFDHATVRFSQPEFCASCHEMQTPHAAWRESPHVVNRSGVRVTCVECHLPPRDDRIAHFAARFRAGAKDLAAHLAGRYDAEQSRQFVRQTLPRERCVRCHATLAESPATRAVAIVHATALARPDDRAHDCIACHDRLHGARPPAPEPKMYEPENNAYCQVCHVNFAGEEFTEVHVRAGIGCIRCHGESDEHAADEEHIAAPQILYAKARVNASCMTADCHPQAAMEAEIGHRPFFAGADPGHAYCTDCHGEHRLPKRTRRWDKDTRELVEMNGIPISATNPIPVRASDAGMM